MYTQHPYWQKNTELLTCLQIIKKEKLKYHMVLSIQTFAVTLIYLNSGAAISSDHPEMVLHLHLSPAVLIILIGLD